MSKILDTIRAAFSAVGKRARAAFKSESTSRRGPQERDALTQQSPGTMTSLTLEQARCVITNHELGQFSESALLAEHLLRDPDVLQALQQRTLAALGLPFELKEADESKPAEMCARDMKPLWNRCVRRSAIAEMLRWSVLLGFAVAQIVWTWDEETSQYLPIVEPWHPAFTWNDPATGKWWASASTGAVEIVPGDGRWILYAPHSPSRSYIYAVIRCLPEWFLSAQFGRRDSNRRSETHGQGVWVPRIPIGWDATPEGQAYVAAIRNMGRSGVVVAPRGATPETSYDLDLVESDAKGWEIFDFLIKTSASKIRLAILGQDMTSAQGPKGGSYAQSKVGNTVRQDVVEADTSGLAETLQEQHGRPWALYLRGKRSLAARPCWDATPPEDQANKATAIKTAGEGLALWTTQMATTDEVPDAEAFARSVGMPLKPRPKDQPKTPAKGTTDA